MTQEAPKSQDKHLAVASQKSVGTHLRPQSLEEAKALASVLAASTLVPQEFRGNAANTLLAIMHGDEIGLSPAQSLANTMVVNGKPAIYGDAMVGVVLNSGLLEDEEEHWDPNLEGGTWTIKVKRVGRRGWVERTFSMKDAERAGLTVKGTWKSYPKRMCYWRAKSWAYRDTFADKLKGIKIAEEFDAIPGEVVKDVTTTAAEAAAAAREQLNGGQQPKPEADKPVDAEIVESKPVETAPAEPTPAKEDLPPAEPTEPKAPKKNPFGKRK